MTAADDPQRFQGTVAFYERYRLAFPDRLVRRVAGLAALNPGDAVLDLGCGSGMLAIPFAKAGMTVTAMDPEPEMLAATRKAAVTAGVRVTLEQASSCDLTPDMGPFRLVVIGRAFHWMDRTATLAMLERIVTPDGGVALFHDAHPPVEENGWFKTVCDISARHRRLNASGGAAGGGGHRRYEPFLLASAFTQLDGLSVTIRRSVSVDEIVGRTFSMSASISDRDALAAELTAALRESAPDGKFTEVAELVALLARRP